MPFTPEELAELAAFDNEIDDNFVMTREERRQSRMIEQGARNDRRDKKEAEIAARRKAYRKRKAAEKTAAQT